MDRERIIKKGLASVIIVLILISSFPLINGESDIRLTGHIYNNKKDNNISRYEELKNDIQKNNSLEIIEQKKTLSIFEDDYFRDIIITNSASNGKISVHLGNGSGEFFLFKNYSLGGVWPGDMVTEDFNKDGFLDVAVPCYRTLPYIFFLTIFLGEGGGLFKEPVNYSITKYPFGITSGDFNNDNNIDLAVVTVLSTSETFLDVFLGYGNGSFGPKWSIELPIDSGDRVVSGDFNNDNFLDLAVVSFNGQSYITILNGNGTGEFNVNQSYTIGQGYNDLEIISCDFNLDGYLDLAVPLNNAGEEDYVFVCYNDGTGMFFDSQNFFVGNWAKSITAGDFNQDGAPDLAVSIEDYIVVLMNNGSGGFEDLMMYDRGYSSQMDDIITADFNRDTYLDLVVTNCLDDSVTFLKGHGDGTFWDRQDFYAGIYPWGLVFGDFNPMLPGDLNGEGMLNWSGIKPGSTIYGDFTVENIGGPHSYLNWRIETFPDWGEWTFNPSDGYNLTSDQGLVTINTTVVVPPIENQLFTGQIKIVNIENSNDYCVISVFLETSENIEKISCNGSLIWTDIKPGVTCIGNFTVENIGDAFSDLNWAITDFPDWGTWSFIPMTGENLTPSDGSITISVIVKAPSKKHTSYTGQIRIINTENSSDYDTIPVSLATPYQGHSTILQILLTLMERFPNAFPLLRFLVGFNHYL